MTNLKLRQYEVLWHQNSGYGGRYRKTTVDARGEPTHKSARGLVAAEECIGSDKVRVDAIREVSD